MPPPASSWLPPEHMLPAYPVPRSSVLYHVFFGMMLPRRIPSILYSFLSTGRIRLSLSRRHQFPHLLILAPRAPGVKPKFRQKQQKELDSLPLTIQNLEKEQEELYQVMGDPDLYKKDKTEISGKKERLEAVKRLLAESYTRWEELEQLKNKL
jgi:hypothetical protein